MNARCRAIALMFSLIAATATAQTTHDARILLGETSSGEVYPDGSTRVGYTLGGAARGDLEGRLSLTLSLQPGHAGPGVTNSITGSNWSLDFDDGTSIWGTVDGGSIVWSSSGHTGAITVRLTIAGGSVSSGSGSVTGTIVRGEGSSRLRGSLSLTF